VVAARVAAWGPYVHAAWLEQPWSDKIVYVRNTSAGDSTEWSSAKTLRSGAFGALSVPDVAAAAAYVYVIWDEQDGPYRVIFNGGSSTGPAIACAPGWSSLKLNDVYVVWLDNSSEELRTMVRFKHCEPRAAQALSGSCSWNFDDHGISDWNHGFSGGNSISVSPGESLTPPNSLFTDSMSPGVAWVETPPCSLDLSSAHTLSAWLYLEGTDNDQVVVMDNQEVRLLIVNGTELFSETGGPGATLDPFAWNFIECCVQPGPGTYDVLVNGRYVTTAPVGSGPANSAVVMGDVADGCAGHGLVRWDEVRMEGSLVAGGEALGKLRGAKPRQRERRFSSSARRADW